MVNIVPVLRVIGGLLIAFAAFMLVPLVVETRLLAQPAASFLISALATAFAGLTLLALSPNRGGIEFSRRQGFLLTALSWIVLPAFGALPLMSGAGLSAADAYFEASSAMTTTGSTVMVGLDTTAPSSAISRGGSTAPSYQGRP